MSHHPSVELHVRFLNAIGYSPEKEDKANRLLPMEIQLGWLRDTGFVEVDCYWKWLISHPQRGWRGPSEAAIELVSS